jgi:hypothetical protein
MAADQSNQQIIDADFIRFIGSVLPTNHLFDHDQP